MKIRFRRKSQAEWITLFVMLMPFCFFLLMDSLHFPSLVKYTVDIGWLFLLIILLRKKKGLPNVWAKKLALIAGLFFALTIIGFLFHYQSGLYYLWGIRNNARFFVFFFACICFIDERGVEKYLNFMDGVFWVNVPVVFYQYYVMGKRQDYLGGIFGIDKGCNGYMNIFFLIIVTRSLLRYLNGQEKMGRFLIKLGTAMAIAALAELKMFFIENALIAVLATLITKFSFRKLWIVIVMIVCMLMAVQLLVYIFPVYEGWFRLDKIWESATAQSGYTSSNDINRVTAVSIALDRFLPSTFDKLFGLGLGNCDYAAFDFLTTPFYLAYKRLNYMVFSSAFLVLETGLVGLLIYCFFFVYLYFAAGKQKKKENAPIVYCQLAQIMSVLCLVLVIYNGSMRTEAAFMMYFVLALPFLDYRKRENVGDPEYQPMLGGSTL